MALGAPAVGLLLAGFAGQAFAETIREVQIGDTLVAYDADRFEMTPDSAGRVEANCKNDRCWAPIGISAARSACGDASSDIPPDGRNGRRTSTSALFSNGFEFKITRLGNGCRNWVAPSLYACVEVGANSVKFSQIVIGCGHGPISRPDMIDFLTEIRLRPAEAR
jgi:hypothetical protein